MLNDLAADRESGDRRLAERCGESPASERDLGLDGRDRQAQAGLHQEEHRPGRPGLRHTGDGIGCRAFRRLWRESTEELGHPMQVEMGSGVEQAMSGGLIGDGLIEAGCSNAPALAVVRMPRLVRSWWIASIMPDSSSASAIMQRRRLQ